MLDMEWMPDRTPPTGYRYGRSARMYHAKRRRYVQLRNHLLKLPYWVKPYPARSSSRLPQLAKLLVQELHALQRQLQDFRGVRDV